jgi:hypothetical protein
MAEHDLLTLQHSLLPQALLLVQHPPRSASELQNCFQVIICSPSLLFWVVLVCINARLLLLANLLPDSHALLLAMLDVLDFIGSL